MLELLAQLSKKLQPFRKLSVILAGLLIGVIVTQLLDTPLQQQSSNSLATLSFVGFIWLILFNLLLSLFYDVPSIDNDSNGLFSQIIIKVKRSFYHFMALLFIGLTLVIVFLSIRMFRV
jgi:4-hydroxybenzoate polyprenyltransferase